MSSRWRRYEVLLPVQFNDGRAVPSEWLAEAVLEIVDHFGAASYETQEVEGHWRHGGVLYVALASLGRCARTCERYHALFSPGSRPTASSQTLSASPTGLPARWACGLMVLGATRC